MMYFLDFDRTLFDTDSYNRSLLEKPVLASLKKAFEDIFEEEKKGQNDGAEKRHALWDEVSARMHSGELTFTPGELSPFVYGDVSEFLRMLGNDAAIITFGEKKRQQMKLESALAGIVRLTVFYTEDVLKGDYLATYPHLVPQDALFVDDRPLELENVATQFPAMKIYEMRRDGGTGDGRWPVVHSLSELP